MSTEDALHELAVPPGVVSMFRDLAARIEVPTREAVWLNKGVQVLLCIPDSEAAIAGWIDGWSIGVSGASDGEGVEVVVVAEEKDDDGGTMGYGAVLRPDAGTLSLVGPILMLRTTDDRVCLVTLLLEVEEELQNLLVGAAVGTLLAWTMPADGDVLH